jgi:ABC-type Fe2+-enterobactin transport system substrate-binding protein
VQKLYRTEGRVEAVIAAQLIIIIIITITDMTAELIHRLNTLHGNFLNP